MRCFGLYLVAVGICIISLTGFCPGQVNGQPAVAPTPRDQFVLRSEMSIKEREKMGRFDRHLPVDFQIPTDDIAKKLLREYGSVFVARNGVTPPKTVVFRDQNEVTGFQKSLETRTETIGGMPMTLQAAAMKALLSAMQSLALLELAEEGQTPCGFALRIMRDQDKPDDLRMHAARLAAPFIHPKPQPEPQSQPERQRRRQRQRQPRGRRPDPGPAPARVRRERPIR